MKKLIIAAIAPLLGVLTACAAQPPLSGAWLGTLQVSSDARLRLVFNLEQASDGSTVFTLDSPDQGVKAIPGQVRYISSDSLNVGVAMIGLTYQGALGADGAIHGIFSQGALTLPMELKRGSVEINRPQTPKPPFPYSTREVTIENPDAPGVTLAATLTLPDGSNSSTPAVVMVSGSGLQNRDEEIMGHKPFAVIADYLARNGVASLRYDDRGFAGSTGDAASATTLDFASDAHAALGWLRKNGETGPAGILGHSEGGLIATILAAGSDAKSRPDFIVGLGTPTMRGDTLLVAQSRKALESVGQPVMVIENYAAALSALYEAMQTREPSQAAGLIDELTAEWPLNEPIYLQLKDNLRQVCATASTPWFLQFIRLNPIPFLKRISCPALFIYGSCDTQVAPTSNIPNLSIFAPEAKLSVLPGLNHLLQPAPTGRIEEYSMIEQTISPSALEQILDFIKSKSH